MAEILRLEGFFLSELTLKWNGPETDRSEAEVKPSFDYRIWRAKDDLKRFRLELTVRVALEGKRPQGCAGQAVITGYFAFPEGLGEEKMAYLSRVNGCYILYGILRGIIASCTGCFPAGKVNLPTVLFSEIVAEVEKGKLLIGAEV